MKIVTIVGARPQFIKAAPVSRELRKKYKEILVHTGQHYDHNMSDIFFEELDIPRPDYNLGVGSGLHGKQTGLMITKVEEVLVKEQPDVLLVYGDTNSTLAGAIAASKLNISIVHIEAGLRSYNRKMPEEINRVLTDHMSKFLFCPTETAVHNLSREGINHNVYNTGDVMYDAFKFNEKIAKGKSKILDKINITPSEYILCTIHRAENTNDYKKLEQILNSLNKIELPIILPLHPRTKLTIEAAGLSYLMVGNVKVIDPVGYLDMIALESNCKKLVTDSGGVQKEAYFAKVPCITVRDETEWVETVEVGWNRLTGANTQKIIDAINCCENVNLHPNIFGEGDSAKKIVKILEENIF